MKKTSLISLCVLSILFVGPMVAIATTVPPTNGTSVPPPTNSSTIKLQNPLRAQSLQALAEDLMTSLLYVAYIVCAFFILYAGFLFVTAQGNSDKTSEAKAAFFNALIGTAIIMGIQLILKVIEGTVNSLT